MPGRDEVPEAARALGYSAVTDRNYPNARTVDGIAASLVDRVLHAAAPAIRNQERQRIEEERCESCDDTGIYTEGEEWAPCGECNLGRGFAKRLKSYVREAREQIKAEINLPREIAAARDKAAQQERQRIQEALEKLAVEFDRRAEAVGKLSMSAAGAFREAASAIRKEAAVLDTLDPSGDKDLAQGAPRPETTGDVPDSQHGPSGHRASVAGETSKSDPSGEQGGES